MDRTLVQAELPADKLRTALTWLETIQPAELIEQSSQTFRAATKLFPEPVRTQVKTVYAFVRVADDLVDLPRAQQPDMRDVYFAYKEVFNTVYTTGVDSGFPVIDQFARIAHEFNFPSEWVNAFFASMEMDLNPDLQIHTETDLLTYDHGSAAVIGLMCARIFGIEDPDALASAGKLGDAFQHINFVRDAFDDITTLGRNYFPTTDFESLGIPTKQNVLELEGEQLQQFIAFQINRFETWLNQGASGFGELAHISPSIAIAVLTASLLYEKAAAKIIANPELIKFGKVSPTTFEKVTSLIQAVLYVYYFILSGSVSQFEFTDQRLNLINNEEP